MNVYGEGILKKIIDMLMKALNHGIVVTGNTARSV